MTLSTDSAWFRTLSARSTARARVRLICFPFAGGSSASYHELAAHIDPTVEVVAVELPGRGTRFAEPLISDIHVIADVLAKGINRTRSLPFALLGYSNGSLLAFEVMRRLTRATLQLLEHCFLCAKCAPQFISKEDAIHHLDDASFLARIESYDGTPPELLASQELREIFLPMLKSDFALSGNYSFVPLEEPLPVPVTLIGGAADVFVPRDKLAAWGSHFQSVRSVVVLEGGHFFLQTQVQALAELLNSSLRGLPVTICL